MASARVSHGTGGFPLRGRNSRAHANHAHAASCADITPYPATANPVPACGMTLPACAMTLPRHRRRACRSRALRPPAPKRPRGTAASAAARSTRQTAMHWAPSPTERRSAPAPAHA
eukprot:2338746-Pleurochrysis_carterae.AAC.4